jgi:hypothetical protein
MSDDPSYRTQRWAKHFEEIDNEIATLCLLLDVNLLEPGVIERVLRNDATVCGKSKPQAFEKMRALLMMHYSVRDNAVVALGEKETMLIIGDIVERLRARFKGRLG